MLKAGVSMMVLPTRLISAVIVIIFLGRVACAQETAESASLRGGGAYLNGLGWYNVNTAKANAINVDATIKWQRELRRFAEEKRGLDARRLAGKAIRIEDVKRRQQAREQQLRTNPSGEDVVSGDALNVLLYDLTDPDFTTDKWLAKPVLLPDGMSVKDVTFQFMPVSVASDSSKALSKGVIALSRLDIEGKWTTAIGVDALKSERTSYEKAFAEVRDQVLAGMLTVDALLAMDRTLDSLRAKVQTAVPMERGFRVEATRYVDDLKKATRMFDASTVEYAKEILLDTQDHDAKTVFELVRFMLKYRLQFASTERSPSGRVLYTQLYELMSQQLQGLGGGLGGGAGAGGKDDSTLMQGTWYTAFRRFPKGKEAPKDDPRWHQSLELKGNHFRLQVLAPGWNPVEGEFRLTPTEKPKLFDFYGKGPKGADIELHGIYEVTEDALRISWTQNFKGQAINRNLEFDGPNGGDYFVFKRTPLKK